ncbi:MAG TPA: ATP-binding protein [Dongiaceae bacterium]|nr:ATP-binding protein [Dongiaceae bacterium]
MAAERAWEASWPAGPAAPSHTHPILHRLRGLAPASPLQARYGLSVALVLGATAATTLLRFSEHGRPTLCLFLGAIVASGWTCGTRPGLVAAGLSTVASLCFYSLSSHGLGLDNVVLVALYAAAALASGLAGAQRRETQDGLRRSHDELARKARELETANGALRVQIAERQRVEEALQKKQAELDHAARLSTLGIFAASIAHEINQPLAAAASSAEICKRWLAEPVPRTERIRAALDRIEREANRAGEVVRRVRAIVAKRPAETAPLSLNAAIEDVLPLIRNGLQRQRIGLSLDLAADLPMLAGDRIQLQQLFLNLVTNAMEAVAGNARHGREIGVATAAGPDGAIRLSVRDNGPGVAAGEIEKLFEPFSSTKPEGMGLGLSICRAIAEAHGGALSAHPGRPAGMVFVATFNRRGGA